MYIDNISTFLPKYADYSRNDLLAILKFANTNGFVNLKLEKDFILTLILIKFGEKYPNLIFKGGTCLNKIYFPYFRLSEDLDFVINHEKGRTARKTLLKQYETDFINDLGLLGLTLQSKKKADEYRLAMFVFEYESVIDNTIQTIKIDISLKRNLKLVPVKGQIKSTYKDVLLEEDIFDSHYISCIDLKESTAEKLRASLTRGRPAIRDFFDIWYIKNNSNFDFEDEEFLKLVELKLSEAGFKYTLEENYKDLERQIKLDLRPVLKEDYEFNFGEIFEFILGFKK